MCRPEIAGWSITMSQAGWRPTTVTGFGELDLGDDRALEAHDDPRAHSPLAPES